MCAASAVLFGATTPISKVLLDSIPPITLAGLLYLGAAVPPRPSPHDNERRLPVRLTGPGSLVR